MGFRMGLWWLVGNDRNEAVLHGRNFHMNLFAIRVPEDNTINVVEAHHAEWLGAVRNDQILIGGT